MNHICINLHAPPVDGEANKELIKYMSGLLEINPNEIKLDKVIFFSLMFIF